jgi:PAS domain S-box-containing protein
VPRNAASARDALRALLDCLPNAAVAIDDNGDVVLANRDADSLLRGNGTLPGRPLADFVPDATTKPAGETWSFADREIDGRIYAPTLRALPPGSPAAGAVVFRDVTSHRRLEAALRRSESHLRAVLDSPIFGVVFWDAGGALTEASDTFLAMIGYTREDLTAGAIRWRDLVPDEHLTRDEAAWEEVRTAGSCAPYERDFLRKDGSRVPVLIGVSTSEGLRNRGLAFTVDTSRRRRAESESRARDEFFGMMSHELRTPINAILGWTQMLRAGTLPEESRARGLAAIERNAHFQARLIEDLLDISRAINGKIELRSTRVDVRSLLDTAAESIRPLLQSRTLVFEPNLGNEPVEVFGDGVRLQQVLMNLLTNAVKFTSATGRIELRARRKGSRLEISVIDDGRGIDPVLLPHVFERFKQGSPPEQSRSSGLGLGLTIAQSLVRLHGGTIDALSDGPGFGATFIVGLPVAG